MGTNTTSCKANPCSCVLQPRCMPSSRSAVLDCWNEATQYSTLYHEDWSHSVCETAGHHCRAADAAGCLRGSPRKRDKLGPGRMPP